MRARQDTELDKACACGGRIVAGAPWAVMDAVQRHNAGPEHRLWRRRRENVEACRAYRARLRSDVERVRLARSVRREAAA